MLSFTRRLFPAARHLRSLTTATTPPTDLSEGEQNIYSKLSQKFSPSQLQVQDVSGGCGTFYAITIASQSFKGLPIVKQHKLVTETLKQEIEGIHGLQIKTIPVAS
ncbi:bola protein [Desarmillaria tabescens]|uniref:Bola protein n=1 Tax=Armillaria tabescens TaxID=1929756 RepID=A0AA39U0C5_ARMTA|nr:bola protein [Desarmillaria tabescens]KAK0468014.1 bola protein [Desarmillaria tabescens]